VNTVEKNRSIRRYRQGDEKQINDLFNQVFDKARDLKTWRWKFQENSGGVNSIIVAEAEGKIVGHYAGLPTLFKFKDRIVKWVQPVDLYILPEFRGLAKGILILRGMSEFGQQIAAEAGIALVYGFPNPLAYAVQKRILKNKDLGSLPTLFQRLNWRHGVQRRVPWVPQFLLQLVSIFSSLFYKMLLLRRRIPLANGVKIRFVPSFDERIDDFWDRLKENYGIIGVRNRRYMNWRYVEKPDDSYEILLAESQGEIIGYSVLKIEQRETASVGFIVDLLAIDPDLVGKLLIKEALRYFLLKRVDYALCNMLKTDCLYPTLLWNGFIEKEGFDAITITYLITDESQVDEQFLQFFTNPANWHLTLGDTDWI